MFNTVRQTTKAFGNSTLPVEFICRRWDTRGVVLLVLSTVLLLGTVATESDYLLAIGGFTAAAAAVCISFPVLISFEANFNPLRLLAASTIFGYGGGMAIGWPFSLFEEVGGFDVVLATYRVEASDMALAIIAANVFGAMLFFLARKTSGIRAPERQFAEQVVASARAPFARGHLYPLAVLLFVLQVYALASGRVGYKGYATSEVIEPVTILLVTVAPLSAFLAGILGGRIRAKIDTGWGLIMMPALGLMNLIWFFSAGRTTFLNICICSLMGFNLVSPMPLRRIIRWALVIGIPMITVAYVLTQNIRQFSWADEAARENVFSVLKVSIAETNRMTQAEVGDTRANQRDHLAYRPLVANFPAQLISRWRSEGLRGVAFEEIFNAMLTAVPRAVYANKGDLPVGEALYHMRFGTSPDDNAESVLMSSLAAFTLVGPPVFALFCWIYVRVLTLGVLASHAHSVTLLGAVTLCWLALSGGELAMVTFFATARNAALIAVMLYVFERFYFGQSTGARR